MQKIQFYLALILIWALVYKLGVEWAGIWQPSGFPSPTAVLDTLWGLVMDRTLYEAMAGSLRRMLIGFILAVLAGAAIGWAIARHKYLNRNLRPLIMGLQTLPSICWVPLTILWFGVTEKAIIFAIITGSAFSIALSIETAIRNVNPLYIKAARTMGATERSVYQHVIFPAGLPDLLAGLKQGWIFAWRALISGEILTSSVGLGQVLETGRELSDVRQVMAAILVIILIGLAVDQWVFGFFEKKLRYRWGIDT